MTYNQLRVLLLSAFIFISPHIKEVM